MPIVIALTMLVALTACGDDDSAAVDPSTSLPSETTAVPTTAVPTTAVPTTEPSSDPSDDSTEFGGSEGGDSSVSGDEDSDGSDGSCIEGDWTVSSEELQGYDAALGEASGVPMTVDGTARIRFIDLQYVYDAVFELRIDIAGQVAVANADGVATGSYVIEDGIISTELGANNLDIVVNVGGMEIDAGDLGNDLLSSFPVNDAPFDCDGPTIYFDTGGPDKHPIRLTPYEG